ncbi:MAG TPA: choice-of-anchor L domain-containing protein [Verrucomicrobiae bacterium]|nr:choice-of-anchor L domain-containing protein [Verrucomicrobiae bacterium]
MRTIALWGASLLTAAATAHAALRTQDLGQGITPTDMINTLLGGGVSVLNVQYTGAPNASGLFAGGNGIIGFDTGILLTSGSASNVIGPNNSTGATTDNGFPGDADLNKLTGGLSTFDAAVLDFDFVPSSNTVQFSYVFGSEEYNEYVGSPFNDVFAFYVNGVNYALIPGTSLPVAITNVNNGYSTGVSGGPCENCQYYIDNVDGHLNTQLDGLTKVLTLTAPVVPNQLNHMKIAIADTSDALLDSAVFLQAGSLRSGVVTNPPTRTSRFWFTHGYSADPTCATLSNAIARIMSINVGIVPLGFLTLPQGYRNSDNVKDSADAYIEALGFYWRSTGVTGETGGTQNQKAPASSVCSQRKKLAVELIAAMANVNYLEADPAMLSYVNAKTNVFFPSDLITQAQNVAAGADPGPMVTMTGLLKLFNQSGQANNYPAGIVECTANKSGPLRSLARDPTSQTNCPGVNNSCQSAQQVYFSSTGSFSSAVFTKSVSITGFTNSLAFPAPTCGTGGRSAVWAVTPDMGTSNRQFSVSTAGSNFSTMLSVWSGSCGSTAGGTSNTLTQVNCAVNSIGLEGASLTFNTDGTNTFYIVGEGVSGQYGKLKIRITSP